MTITRSVGSNAGKVTHAADKPTAGKARSYLWNLIKTKMGFKKPLAKVKLTPGFTPNIQRLHSEGGMATNYYDDALPTRSINERQQNDMSN